MKISELTDYALKKYNIPEEHKWAKFPRYSVLTDPASGSWAALLIREWDPVSLTEKEYCDIRCGNAVPDDLPDAPYLTAAHRMNGNEWLGVEFGDGTDRDVILGLFDKALNKEPGAGFTVVLENTSPRDETTYSDTPLVFSSPPPRRKEADLPPRIREMMTLFPGSGFTFKRRCITFFAQARFMESYEDDAPWEGSLCLSLPAYSDLDPAQLRGYFTWRTKYRRGEVSRGCPAFGYIYIFELLNGIGASSAEDSLGRLKDFEKAFIDAGFGDRYMKRSLHRWMTELAVISGIPSDAAMRYADPDLAELDRHYSALLSPDSRADSEIFAALCYFGGKKAAGSAAVKKHGSEGISLYALVWKTALAAHKNSNGRDLFTEIFGKRRSHRWMPLENALYYSREEPAPDTLYELNEFRRYLYRSNFWLEECYSRTYFSKARLEQLLHETERLLRLYLKTGGAPLKAMKEGAWAVPYIEAAIEADKLRKLEASRPRITINFDDLDRIRQDALETQESLLTEEELPEAEPDSPPAPEPCSTSEDAFEAAASENPFLTAEQEAVLRILLEGGTAREYISQRHLLAEVVADGISEALFDELGDTAVECIGGSLALVEDYREDIIRILGGKI